jgi:Uncharacterized conserved protein
LKTKQIVVLPYDENWSAEFQKIKAELISAVGGYVLRIEHVGSTSVAGLSAKPIIDIDAIIPDYSCFPDVAARLSLLGYEHEGNLGIPDREAFQYTEKPHLMLHHLYVCPQYSEELKRHLIFRDYLRNHKEDVEAYSRIKEQAALLYPSDIDSYLRYKSPVIEAIYRKCGLRA